MFIEAQWMGKLGGYNQNPLKIFIKASIQKLMVFRGGFSDLAEKQLFWQEALTLSREFFDWLPSFYSSITLNNTFKRIFKASALWADAFYKSKCPSVCLSVRPSVCLCVHF